MHLGQHSSLYSFSIIYMKKLWQNKRKSLCEENLVSAMDSFRALAFRPALMNLELLKNQVLKATASSSQVRCLPPSEPFLQSH